MFSGLRDFVSNNAVLGHPGEEEKKLREISPTLLGVGERVVFAFLGRGGKGRDSYYFTSTRLLVRDVTGMTGKRVKYTSTPWKIIKAWAVSTAGGGIDSDCELQIWASGMPRCEIEFSKDKVDIFALNQFLNQKCLPEEQAYAVTIPDGVSPGGQFPATLGGQAVTVTCPPNMRPGMRIEVKVPSTNPGTYSDGHYTADQKAKVGDFLNWIGSDAKQVDPKELESRLRTAPAVLAPDERVEMAFKCGRDYTLLSSKRMLHIDPRGMTGKKVVYLTLLWKCVRAFRVETVGTFDTDAELSIFTNIDSLKEIKQDLRKGQCDPLAVQRFLSDMILGMDQKPYSNGGDVMQGKHDTGPSLLALFGDDFRQIDAAKADAQFRSNPALLQGSERCEMAFKGRRDIVLFTTKRMVAIDVQGLSGRKQSFLSVPWTTVKCFGVRSAGSMMDKDSEMMIWTDIMHDPPPPPKGEGDNPPPEPGMSYLELDFQKDKVDLMAVNRYLAARVLSTNPDYAVPANVMAASPSGAVEGLLSWIGNDGHQIDAGSLQAQLQQGGVILPNEKVAMAFRAGRDTFALTDKRVFVIDVQGFSGKRVSYNSIPYGSIRAFAVESAGTFDRDAEIKIYTRNHWDLKMIKQDLRSGKCNILEVQRYLAQHLIGIYSGASGLGVDRPADPAPADVGGVAGFLSWLGDDAQQISADVVNQRLHGETPILLPDEVVDLAFKCGRDMYVHTSKRMLFIDVQGWAGKKVEYETVPLKYCTGFEVQTAGMLDRDSELKVFTDVPARGPINQDLRNGQCDLFQVQNALSAKLTI